MIAAVGICSSCKKAATNDDSPEKIAAKMSVAAPAASAAMKSFLVNMFTTNGANLETNVQLQTNIQTFAENIGRAFTNEITLETTAAGIVFKRLHDEGKIPGISKNEHGQFRCDFDFMISNRPVQVTYPAIITLRGLKEGTVNTNNYTLIKQSKDAEWKLQRAWQADSNGETIQEWPIQ